MDQGKQRYQLSETFSYRRVGGEVFGISDDQAFHNLRNSTALSIFDALASKPQGPDELIQIMLAEFNVAEDEVRTDVDEFLVELVSRGIAERCPTPSNPLADCR